MKNKIVNIILFLSILIITAVKWNIKAYGHSSIDEMIYTMLAPLEGVDTEAYFSFVKYTFKYLIIFEIIWFVIFKNYKLKVIHVVLSLGILLVSLIYANSEFNFFDYFFNRLSNTDIYKNKDIYANPKEVTVKGTQTNNLIYIYVESMENTFTDIENGGINKINYIPELTSLAKKNISFSNNNLLGGPLNTSGSTWTMGSMVCQMAGLPLKNTATRKGSFYQEFMPGAYTIGDILANNNYLQEFLIGQDSNFAYTDKLFIQHGNYNIYDIDSIKQDYNVPADAECGWGINDYYLFEIAKDRLNIIVEKAKQENRNFNLTLATIDCHSPDGFKCKYCEDKYDNEYYNIVACESKLIYEFVEWCKTQDWYANTTIVIVGDHPTMAESHLGTIEKEYERTTYNCFINSKVESNNTKNRIFTRLDFYPTTLAALGFEIENNKLALGTNLFSSIETNAEKNGIEYLRSELKKTDKEFEKNIYSTK